jgi:ADP-heptose:LPS heptosyltransferase
MTLPGIEGIDCRYFNGYKPCFPGVDCTSSCALLAPMGTRVLIINLDAMGDVLMTTAQLPGIRRDFPQSHVTWLTRTNAAPLLAGNPLVDRVITWNDENRLVLKQQRFDVVMNGDKSEQSCAFTRSLNCGDVRGFTLSDRGQIIAANPEAEYNFRLGLDDHLKFRVNQRTGQDILAETWKLSYRRDDYILELTEDERRFCEVKASEWGLAGKTVVGFNTGCSELYPNKKMTVEQHAEIIGRLASRGNFAFLLLGGREDEERNSRIAGLARASGAPATATPTGEGLRRGICYENLADIVLTGDSLGMHIAIGLKKHVLAWFGLSCWSEIDLYDRGRKFFRGDLDCSPCWKRVCPKNLECISGIDIDAIIESVLAYEHALAAR